MKADMEFFDVLDDIHFKYKRMEAIISILQQYISECVDVAGAPENAVENLLYEIELGMMEADKRLSAVLKGAEVLKELKSA